MAPETQGFLKNCWYVAAWDHELIDGRLMARTILEKPILLDNGDSGRVVALDNRCCHRGAKLSNGRLEGDDVRCMCHGLKFDPSGKCIQIPGQDNIPPKLGVRSYPVVERDHLVWIWMGEPAQADPAKILDFPYLRDPTIALSLHDSLVQGFLEDKFIIEGQQEVLDADPDFRMNGIVSDAPLAHFRRTLGRLIDAERQGSQALAA